MIRAQATIPATPRKVWNEVSEPWNWVAIGRIPNPAGFFISLQDEPSLEVRGRVVVDEPPAQVAFTYSWTTAPLGDSMSSWWLPAEPTTVRISLHRAGKGLTTAELEHRDLPAELAGTVRPFWEWALQRKLPERLAKAPFHGYPWQRAGP